MSELHALVWERASIVKIQSTTPRVNILGVGVTPVNLRQAVETLDKVAR
jgi:hypothetical protein